MLDVHRRMESFAALDLGQGDCKLPGAKYRRAERICVSPIAFPGVCGAA